MAEIEFPKASIAVEVGGVVAARAAFTPRDGWDEVLLRVPGPALHSGRPRLRILGRFASFYYRLFQ